MRRPRAVDMRCVAARVCSSGCRTAAGAIVFYIGSIRLTSVLPFLLELRKQLHPHCLEHPDDSGEFMSRDDYESGAEGARLYAWPSWPPLPPSFPSAYRFSDIMLGPFSLVTPL